MAPFLAGSVWFLVLGVAIWPLYVQGGPDLFTVAGQTITFNGLLFGLAMGLRVALMVTAAGVWMMTTSPQKLTVGLLHLGLPYKAGVAMTAAIRFVPLLNAERATIAEAQQARALDLRRGNPLSRALKSVAIIGPLFIRAIDVAQGLALASSSPCRRQPRRASTTGRCTRQPTGGVSSTGWTLARIWSSRCCPRRSPAKRARRGCVTWRRCRSTFSRSS